VVDARTFEAVCLRGSPRTELIRGAGVPIAAATDLALLKLLACRDQDLVDVLLLAAGGAIDTDEIARSAALDDVERHVSAGAMRARHELASGGLAATALQALGRPASEHEQHALEEMLRALAREDL
jgi:hypothetical protein